MLQGISAVAFDLDGTLYPNSRLYIRLLPFLLRHWPLVAALGRARNIIRQRQEQSPTAYVPDFYGYQAEITASLLKTSPEQVREKLEHLVYRGWEAHFANIKLFPYLREFLVELRTTPLKLGLLSDFPPKNKLEKLGIADCWDAVLASEDTGALKPAIRPFAELARTLNCPPEQILYVGNSRHCDVGGAKRAGMKTALITTRFAPCKTVADFTFHDYRQLRDFVLE
ncbi:MAG: HAD family hydrolase [Treponema sp.]|nr:HAD family hydrolase [Treponema sp.]